MDRYANSLRDALTTHSGDRFEVDEVRPAWRSASAGTRVRRYWYQYPKYLRCASKTHFDLNHVIDHSYAHIVYGLDGNRTAVTCHDIFPLKHWKGEIEGLPPRRVPPLTVLASLRGLRRAQVVITPSAATKADLVRHLDLDPARIHVIPYGLDPSFRRFPPEVREELLQRLPLGGAEAKHLLSIDTGGPYKNQAATIQVLARITEGSEFDVRLVRAGAALSPSDRELAAELGVTHRVIELGAVGPDEMPALYNRCDVLVFPSFYEGFGWPPLEAMGCGLPVVCSRWASLLEVVGDAAPTAEATDYDALASCVARFLDDPDEAEAVAQRGSQRAGRFTWALAAAKTAEIYGAMGG